MRSQTPRITDQCFAAVIRNFMNSQKFKGYSPATQDIWGRELRRMERPDMLGAISVFGLRSSLFQAYLDGLVNFPAKQASALSVARQLEKYALVRDLLPNPFTIGCEAEGSDGGHAPWSEEHVALAEAHGRPELARMITLAAGTGQRGSDLVRMRWTDIEEIEGHVGIHVVQKKTGRKLWVPFSEPLIRAMASWERMPGHIGRRPSGLPWRRVALSDSWREERDGNPALKPISELGLVMHGLRATACVRLNRAGATSRQISDWIGMSEPMVSHYLRFSVQKQNALAAVIMLNRTARERDRERKA